MIIMAYKTRVLLTYPIRLVDVEDSEYDELCGHYGSVHFEESEVQG